MSHNHGSYVRVLGLGAKNVLDYSADPRYARVSFNDQDYVRYGAGRWGALGLVGVEGVGWGGVRFAGRQ